MKERSQERMENDKWCKENKVHKQTLINKHSKVVYVEWTSITLCENETP
jgi:hypothetical protein